MKIAVIDADSLAFAAGNPNKVLDENNNPIKVLSDAGNMVFQYIDKTEEELEQSVDFVMQDILLAGGFTHYIGFIKGKNTITDRKLINPEYKANRPKESPKWWNTVKQALINKWNVIETNDMEVDDAVNITRLQLPNSHIVAIDGDLLGLAGQHFNWRSKEWVTVSKEQALYKFWADMIVGQPGDNVQGLKGKGKKYVEKLFLDLAYYDNNFILAEKVLKEYINQLGEYKGIKEFYKNYMSLYILEEKEGFIIPQINHFKDGFREEESN
jgi:hypothetical protein